MSSSDQKTKAGDTPHVSLFPSPPWQLVNKHQVTNGEGPPRPPSPPASNVYRMFGNLYNAGDAILRSLESQGVRRVYPQIYHRKRELQKINFSILANYLDLLDIITRDPSSPKRAERLEHLSVLFINMHHLVNEYRQHQARDLLREILRYQVNVASQTVEKAEQYLTRADDLLRNAGNDLILPNQAPSSIPASSSSSSTAAPSCIDTVRSGLSDFGPELSALLQTVLDETMGPTSSMSAAASCTTTTTTTCQQNQQRLVASLPSLMNPTTSNEAMNPLGQNWADADMDVDGSEHLDSALWSFLSNPKPEAERDVANPEFGGY